MTYLATSVSDVEEVSPKRECVDVGAKFEGETKERRNECGRLCACPFQGAYFGIRDTVGKLIMLNLIHQRLQGEVDTF